MAAATDQPAQAGGGATLIFVPRRSWGPWVAAAVLALVVAEIVVALVRTPNINWDLVQRNVFEPSIMHGLRNTVELTVLAMLIGTLLGVGLAMLRLSSNGLLRGIAVGYAWLFRSVPVLVQLLFWYNLALLFKKISIGIPFTGLHLYQADTNSVITGFVASMLGLGLAEAAYAGEIVRGGILAVGRDQMEAAMSLGMRRSLVLRRILLPQAMRVLIPPMGNQVIGMTKATALVSVVSGADLLENAQIIYSRDFDTIELLTVVSIWYVVLVAILSAAQAILERSYGKGFSSDRISVLGGWRRQQAFLG